MFIHKDKNIIIPHRNHANYCWDLVNLRWNGQFKLPIGISLSDLILWIADHDRGYDEFDTINLIKIQDEERDFNRLSFIDKTITRENNNHIANLISLKHVTTLCGKFEKRKLEIEELIKHKIIKYNINLDFDNIQTITNLLDNISFDASIGEDTEESFEVFDYNTQQLINITYEIKNNKIIVNPRPFKVRQFSLPLYGYKINNYPETKILSLVLYHFSS